VIRKEGGRLIVESVAPQSLLVLATLVPIDEEFPEIPDTIPHPVEL